MTTATRDRFSSMDVEEVPEPFSRTPSTPTCDRCGDRRNDSLPYRAVIALGSGSFMRSTVALLCGGCRRVIEGRHAITLEVA